MSSKYPSFMNCENRTQFISWLWLVDPDKKEGDHLVSPTSGTQISQFQEKKTRPCKRSHGICYVTYPGHCCERARHCKLHGPETRRSRHETLHHGAYERIEAYVSEFEAEPATKYLTRYFSLYEATVGLKHLLFLGCRAPTLLGRISEMAHYEADARCTWGGVFLTCAFFCASNM